mmetsp:Transcript_29572/g.62728  ORF Transcript_29572/g.62728 Transcript_29572/m.62728 type:complete len:418 (-) Transcript_29572:122-1375(-)|eukprot:CAMPEP_0172321508 /NCGR_PEP_ID=MMETSP1058-20130122/43610_1 /TAXON_ID=83371 /ORGANISM="Detonula confervacea, Strain CCMP 353" /LENGTH=417 /DNA_ID=CAMNT_0013037035 /DNA_START=90 /DNA_END=1343 /DNA_ORIENTATION=-
MTAHLHRRSQKQRHGHEQSSSQKPTISKSPTHSQAEAIQLHIQRLDRAKRNIGLFNKVTLCIVALCMGNNIYTKLSKHSDGGGASIWGEAFQSKNDAFWKKQSNRHWALFGNRRNLNLVPRESLQDFGSYPNILNITSAMRNEFHPVVKLPLRKKGKNSVKEEGTFMESESQQRSFWPWRKQNKKHLPSENDSSCIALERKMNETYDYIVKDYTENNSDNDNSLFLEGGKKVPQLLPTREEALEFAKLPKQSKKFDVGRYDEDRRGMYTSSLFLDENNRRTVHIGIDIGGPVGTTVYAFEDGMVHSVGYNPDVGDYGNVIVIEHHLRNNMKVYALYGHLSAKSIQGKYPGQKVKRGQSVGYLGSTAENGGWTGTHLHFQLAVHPPPTHDMPGVVTSADRDEALLEYVDPRYALGELY